MKSSGERVGAKTGPEWEGTARKVTPQIAQIGTDFFRSIARETAKEPV